MKRLWSFLAVSGLALLVGVMLVAGFVAARARFDFATVAGMITGGIFADLAMLPLAILSGLSQPTFASVGKVAACAGWLGSALSFSSLPQWARWSVAVGLPILWVACLAAGLGLEKG